MKSKEIKKIVEEVISEIASYRTEEMNSLIDMSFDVKNEDALKRTNPLYHNFETISKYYSSLEKLNKLLDLEDKIDLKNDIINLQEKEVITVREFKILYGKSPESQKNLRGRIHDPLPYQQTVKNGKITYKKDEVKNWLDNQHK